MRAEGAVDANGEDVPKDSRNPVRPRTVGADLKWLKHVIGWATRWKTASGAFLMREDPTKGWEVPSDPNPRQPVATWERYEKIRAVADQVTMTVVQDGQPRKTVTYLPELLDLVIATGRRRSAVCKLRYRDLKLDSPRPMDLPKGTRWRKGLRHRRQRQSRQAD